MLGTHVVTSVALLIGLDGPFALWLMMLGPGFVIALGRLIAETLTVVRRTRRPAGEVAPPARP